MNEFLRKAIYKIRQYLDQFFGTLVDFLQKIRLIKRFTAFRITPIGPVVQVNHPYPANYREEDQVFFQTWKKYETLSLEIYSVKDVRVTTEGAVLKGILPFIPALPHPVFRFKFGLLYNLLTRIRYRKLAAPDTKYLLVYDFWSKANYYHWCIDSLCRLWMSHEFLKGERVLLLPDKPPSYIADSIKAFGITRIEYIPPFSLLEVRQVEVMNYAAGSGRHHPEILNKVREFFVRPFRVNEDILKRKIYVSRGKQSSRRVYNETELIGLLQQYGFEIHYFEGMNLHEQIALMQETAVFISSHGANMTNCLFLPEKAKVLELINNRKPNFCYWSVCASIGIPYYYQLCVLAESDHIIVDLEELRKNLILLEEEASV
jgi:hypothetical protein